MGVLAYDNATKTTNNCIEMKKKPRLGNQLKTVGVCMGVFVSSAAALYAQADASSVQKLNQENMELKKRLDAIESAAKKEGWMPSGAMPVTAMSKIAISGFVTASYFHDSSSPDDHTSPGYLWNRENDSFTLNKFKLTIASPAVERSGDKFDAGFRTSLIFGQDAPIVNSDSSTTGFEALREAYVEMNIPIGTGLNFKAGELISLLNYESGDGGAVNANFSQGYQWFFTGNGPAAGAQLGYTFTDWLGMKFRVQNGLYAGPVDNNTAKTLLGSIELKPCESTWVNLIGFGGREDSFVESVVGASLLGGWKATSQLTFGTELDFFNFYNGENATPKGHSDVYSMGLWTDYAFTKKVDLALRAEFLSDSKGVDASGGALGFLNSAGTGQDLTSIALTLNYTPLPNIKIQPEIRFDHTSWSGGFVPGKQNRVIFGAGASYLF